VEKRIKISLNDKSIDSAIQKLTKVKKALDKEKDNIIRDLAEQTVDKAKEFYSGVLFKSNNETEFNYKKTEKGYQVFAKGKSLLYDEFGTGDEGKASPHKLKGQFDLNDYNSGQTIRPASMLTPEKQAKIGIKSGLYWTYKDPVTGDIVYTQGIPAGMFMYNTDKWLRDNYKEIIKKKVDDVISKV
jgi:hypothetical protein